MNYFIDWTDEMLDMLATVWTSARDKKAVTAAEAEICRLLGDDPVKNGSLLSEDLYAIDVHPLRVLYEVSESDRVVEIAAVRLLKERSNGNGDAG